MNTKTVGFGAYLWRATKATLLGGLAFLLPLVVVLVILGKAMTFSAHVMEPVIKHLPPSPLTASVIGATSLVALIVVSLLAGLVAQTRIAKRVVDKLEDTVFGGIPQYQFAKCATSSFAQLEQSEGLEPVLVSIEERRCADPPYHLRSSLAAAPSGNGRVDLPKLERTTRLCGAQLQLHKKREAADP